MLLSPVTPLKYKTFSESLLPITTLDCKLIKSLDEFMVSAPLLFNVKSVKLTALPIGAPKLNLKQLPIELLIINCAGGKEFDVIPIPILPLTSKFVNVPKDVILG